jgi:hypothetical protein
MTDSAWRGSFKGLSPSITPFGKRRELAISQNKNIKNTCFVNTKKFQCVILVEENR